MTETLTETRLDSIDSRLATLVIATEQLVQAAQQQGEELSIERVFGRDVGR